MRCVLVLALDRLIYDRVYFALAHRIGAMMLTTDRRFANTLASTEHGAVHPDAGRPRGNAMIAGFFRSSSCPRMPGWPVTGLAMRGQAVDSTLNIPLPGHLTRLARRFKSPFQGHRIREDVSDATRRKRPRAGANSPRSRQRQHRLEGRGRRRIGGPSALTLSGTSRPPQRRAVWPVGGLGFIAHMLYNVVIWLGASEP